MNKEIEYLKEHLYEIYKYKKSMQDLTYDMDIEHLLRTCKALDYLQQEIDRLNNIINELEKYLIEHIDEYRDMEQDGMFEFGLVLDKLKELKENK